MAGAVLRRGDRHQYFGARHDPEAPRLTRGVGAGRYPVSAMRFAVLPVFWKVGEMAEGNGWDEYRKLILDSLSRLEDGQHEMRSEIKALSIGAAEARGENRKASAVTALIVSLGMGVATFILTAWKTLRNDNP